MDDWYLLHCVCPRDRSHLHRRDDRLECEQGHVYDIPFGVPVLLVDEAEATHHSAQAALEGRLLYPESVTPATDPQAVDPFVQGMVSATCGSLYQATRGKLERYPIPVLPPAEKPGEPFLEIGCNWGRWCLAAARAGHRPIGIDPSLDAILAARRVAAQLGIDARYLVADGRHLPFADDAFAMAFSFSVLQHLSKLDVGAVVAEIGRVLQPEGTSLVQMPNRWGIRSLQHQLRRRFREATGFEVRYWGPGELRRRFGEAIGPTTLRAEGFFLLNTQLSEIGVLPWRSRWLVRASACLRRVANLVAPLRWLADSLWVRSIRP